MLPFADALTLAPLVPPLLLGALALALCGLVGVAVWRRARGAWIRLIPGVALLLALANPQSLVDRQDPLSDVVVIAVDDSRSNTLADRTDRTAQALNELRTVLAGMPNLDVRLVRVPDDPDGRGTRLMTPVLRALADIPEPRRAGVIALTDGRVHDADAASADALSAPLHVLLTGTPDEDDRRLIVDAAPGYGLVGRPLSARLRLEDPTLAPGTGVPLTVRRDGSVVAERTIPANRPTRIELTPGHAGANVFSLSVPARDRELTAANNSVALSVNGVRDRLRVLLISGQPHPGERVWRNLLKADPNVDLVHFTILRPPSKDDSTPLRELALIAFPVRELFEERLPDFDLVIFDRYSRRGLVPVGYLDRVRDYVMGGGALLVAAGPELTDPVSLVDSGLASVLPVTLTRSVIEQPFQPRLSETGRRHPVTASLPGGSVTPEGGAPAWGPWVRLIEVRPMSGQTLLESPDGRPVLHLSRAGDGRVGLLLSDTAWLWARGFDGGGPLAEMLRRTAHWLMKEPDLEEEALRAVVEGSALSVVRNTMDPAAAADPVTVTDPAGAEVSLSLDDQGDGRATAHMRAEQPGLYTLSDGQRTAVAVVGRPNPPETAAVTTTEAALRPVVETTDGSLSWLSETGVPRVRRVPPTQPPSGPGWIGLRESGAVRVTGVDQTSLMPPWLALMLVAGGLGWAWWREGR